METLSREAFANRLRRLDDDELAAFVADCWAARGWTTSVAGDTVVATDHPTNPDRHLGIGPRADAPTVVVRPGDADAPEGRTVLDAADLHGLCAYALDRETADALCRRHLGTALTAAERASAGERLAGYLPARGTVEVFALLVVVAGGVLLLVPAGPTLPGLAESASVAPATPAAGGTGGVTMTPMDTPTSDAAVAENPPIPGLSAEGITDLDRFADAHAAAVTGRSYRLTLAHREWVGDEIAGGTREVVTVSGPATFATSVERWGHLQTAPAVVAATETYADGQYRYERVVTANGTSVRRSAIVAPSGGEGVQADRVERYLRWFLAANETDVTAITSIDGSEVSSVATRNDSVAYRVTASGTDFAGAENYEATALVTGSGFVRQLRASYDVPDSDVRVSVTMRYSAVGETTVEPPRWYREATGSEGNGTGDGGATGTPTGEDANGTAWDDGDGGGTVSTGDAAVAESDAAGV